MNAKIIAEKEREYIFGPAPSRRLGRSLGIDLVPFKTCTYDASTVNLNALSIRQQKERTVCLGHTQAVCLSTISVLSEKTCSYKSLTHQTPTAANGKVIAKVVPLSSSLSISTFP